MTLQSSNCLSVFPFPIYVSSIVSWSLLLAEPVKYLIFGRVCQYLKVSQDSKADLVPKCLQVLIKGRVLTNIPCCTCLHILERCTYLTPMLKTELQHGCEWTVTREGPRPSSGADRRLVRTCRNFSNFNFRLHQSGNAYISRLAEFNHLPGASAKFFFHHPLTDHCQRDLWVSASRVALSRRPNRLGKHA